VGPLGTHHYKKDIIEDIGNAPRTFIGLLRRDALGSRVKLGADPEAPLSDSRPSLLSSSS
jgi:hypothetical protein